MLMAGVSTPSNTKGGNRNTFNYDFVSFVYGLQNT